MNTGKPAHVSWKRVAAFRLARHYLTRRAPASELVSVAGEMGGAQAQLLVAGQTSLGIRLRNARLGDVDAAVWKRRTLVKAWCMRRTMFLVPSAELADFARGSALRAEREVRWVLNKGVPQQKLERLLAAVLESLGEPVTPSTMVERVSRSLGYRVRHVRGGSGWGDRRKVPWLVFGDRPLPATYLLHLAGARGVYCSGPNVEGESTFVRADSWVPHWKDVPRAEAERRLLRRYLGAYGPATPADFAVWTGMTLRDAQRIWSLEAEAISSVDVDGSSAAVLAEDLDELEAAETDGPVVRLLPFFDSFILGHKSHRNIVSADDQRRVYSPQGWVSPVLLLNGKAAGVWSHSRKNGKLDIAVSPFGTLPRRAIVLIREEAEALGGFLGTPEVRVNSS